MLDLTPLIGSINNTVYEAVYGVDGSVSNPMVVYDIPYIIKAVLVVLSFWFFYKLILALVHHFGGGIK